MSPWWTGVTKNRRDAVERATVLVNNPARGSWIGMLCRPGRSKVKTYIMWRSACDRIRGWSCTTTLLGAGVYRGHRMGNQFWSWAVYGAIAFRLLYMRYESYVCDQNRSRPSIVDRGP